ncbi:hypothetical protein Tco_1164184 [Tanacetum coccineum]
MDILSNTPTAENKVLVARNAEFLENSLINQEASGSLEDLEIIQEEDTHPSIDTSLNHEDDDLEIDEPQSDIIPIPMNVEMQSMKDNEVWVLVELPPNGKTVGSKWLFKKKTDMDGAVHTYKARMPMGYKMLNPHLPGKCFAMKDLVKLPIFLESKSTEIDQDGDLHGLLLRHSEESQNTKDMFSYPTDMCSFEWKVLLTGKCQASIFATSSQSLSILLPLMLLRSPFAIANESGITKGARHFRAKVHYLREVIEFGDIKFPPNSIYSPGMRIRHPQPPMFTYGSVVISKIESGKRVVKGSMLGGMKETQDMLNFCGKHNITCDIEIVTPDKINDALTRLANKDVNVLVFNCFHHIGIGALGCIESYRWQTNNRAIVEGVDVGMRGRTKDEQKSRRTGLKPRRTEPDPNTMDPVPVYEWPSRVTLGKLLPHARGLGFEPHRGGFPLEAKKEWGLSHKAKVQDLHTAQLDVTMTTSSANNSVFRGFFEKQKLTGPNFIDWYRQLRIVLSIDDKLNYLEQPLPPAPVAPAGQQVAPEILAAHTAWVKGSKEIAGLMLMTMEPEIQRNLETLHANDMLKELKALFASSIAGALQTSVFFTPINRRRADIREECPLVLSELLRAKNASSGVVGGFSSMWKMQSMKDTKFGSCVELPPMAKPFGSMWLFRKKIRHGWSLYNYKAVLWRRANTQTPGIDYEETFLLLQH